MNREQLRETLLDLAKEEPEFMQTLIGEVIKNNLSIGSASDGDFYNPGRTYVLQWKEDSFTYGEFSRAY